MTSIKLSAVALAVAAFGTSAMAQSPVGVWKGHIVIDKMPPIPANAPPAQKKMMEDMFAKMKQMVFTLTFKKDKTCTIGVPAMAPGGKPTSQNGTWTQSGKTVTIKSDKKTGGPNDAQSGTLSADGKTLTINPPAQGGFSAKLVLKKS